MNPITRHMTDETLQSGIRLITDPFGSSEAVSLDMSFAGGKNVEKKPLTAALTAFMLGEGTRKRSKKAIQIFLDSIGASREYEGLGDRIEVSGKVRQTHLKEFLALIAEEMREPLFSSEELSTLKRRTEGVLDREAQDTRKRAEIAFSRLLYEKNHPNYERDIPELRAALTKVAVEDLREHHRRCVGSRELIITLSGAVTHAHAKKLVEDVFSDLPAGLALKRKNTRPTAPSRKTETVLVPHKASIDYLLGCRIGIGRLHPDFNALLLGLRILGNPGGFKGKLMQVIREEEGLTYGVYAFLKGFGDGSDGHAVVWGTFAPSLFEKGRTGIMREAKKMLAHGVSPRDLHIHKKMLADGWHVRLSSTEARAGAILDTIHDGLPLSHLDTFPQTIGKLTRAAVNAALRKYFSPRTLSEVAAGPVADISLKH